MKFVNEDLNKIQKFKTRITGASRSEHQNHNFETKKTDSSRMSWLIKLNPFSGFTGSDQQDTNQGLPDTQSHRQDMDREGTRGNPGRHNVSGRHAEKDRKVQKREEAREAAKSSCKQEELCRKQELSTMMEKMHDLEKQLNDSKSQNRRKRRYNA